MVTGKQSHNTFQELDHFLRYHLESTNQEIEKVQASGERYDGRLKVKSETKNNSMVYLKSIFHAEEKSKIIISVEDKMQNSLKTHCLSRHDIFNPLLSGYLT